MLVYEYTTIYIFVDTGIKEDIQMKNNIIGRIMIVVSVATFLYIIAPDFFVGPIDDTAVTAVASIAEVVLAVLMATSNRDPYQISDNEEEYY